MSCPEGAYVQNEDIENKRDESICQKKEKKLPTAAEGSGSLELNSYKNIKTWKKSISSFFRNQGRSTRSNEGDRPSGSTENFEEKEISPEQKWQSLGKIFRRHSLVEHGPKSPRQGDSTSQTKRHAVKKAITNYFGKNTKSSQPSPTAEE